MNKKLISVFVLACAGLLFGGCATTSQQDSLAHDRLIGRWTAQAAAKTINLDLRPDGTFILEYKNFAQVIDRQTGTWNLSGNLLSLMARHSKWYAIAMPKLMAGRIDDVKNNSFELTNMTGDVLSLIDFVRKKDAFKDIKSGKSPDTN